MPFDPFTADSGTTPRHVARLQVPSEMQSIGPVQDFIDSYALTLKVPEDKRQRVLEGAKKLLESMIRNNEYYTFRVSLKIKISCLPQVMVIEILNHGFPIFYDSINQQLHIGHNHDQELKGMGTYFDDFVWENLGRKGQCIRLMIDLDTPAINKATLQSMAKAANDDSKIEIRAIRIGEEAELTRLFCSVYGYNYINEYVYYPEKLRELIETKKLISRVAALPSGRIVGHIGLVRWNDDPVVYEMALGLTDPNIKARGMFSQLLQVMMDISSNTAMQYCVYDFVTNHEYSQKQVAKYGSCDMALFVGSQVSDTQAKLEKLGIGVDSKEMDRYSILLGIKPETQFPFGKEVALPVNIGEMAEFILTPLGLSWVPAPRFYPLPLEGEFSKQMQPTQKAVIFDLFRPGYKALKAAVEEGRHLLRQGYCYCAIDMPLDNPGVGQTYDYLSKNGFFVSGFVPYRFSDRLGVRFQSIGPTRVAFDDIKVWSETARKLLEIVRKNYERNCLL
jgi:hypothetical protein